MLVFVQASGCTPGQIGPTPDAARTFEAQAIQTRQAAPTGTPSSEQSDCTFPQSVAVKVAGTEKSVQVDSNIDDKGVKSWIVQVFDSEGKQEAHFVFGERMMYGPAGPMVYTPAMTTYDLYVVDASGNHVDYSRFDMRTFELSMICAAFSFK